MLSSDDIGVKILHMLGIDTKNCFEVTIKMKADENIAIEAKYYVDPLTIDDDGKLVEQSKHYKLVEIDEHF